MLRAEARRAGEDAETGTRGVGPSGWSGLEHAPAGDEHAVISVGAASEKVVLDRYRSALEPPNLPPDLRALLQMQFTRIAEMHERLEALRDSTAVS